MTVEDALKTHLDSAGRLLRLPAKFKMQVLAYFHLATAFEPERIYSQFEIDAILTERHTFNDCCTLRRGLIDFKLLERTPDGRKYWVSTNPRALSDWGFPESETKEETHGSL